MAKRHKILLLNGVNMFRLGKRDPKKYGMTTAAELDALMREHCERLGVDATIFYTNYEGEAIERICQAVDDGFDGLAMNPGGFNYNCYALRDCIRESELPYMEIHMTKAVITDGFHSVLASSSVGMICGLGVDSFYVGIDGLVRTLRRREKAASISS